MVDKKIIIGVSVCVSAAVIALGLGVGHKMYKKHKIKDVPQTTVAKPAEQPRQITLAKPQNVQLSSDNKADLYSSTPYDIPLVSIAEINNLSPDIKKKVDNMLDSSQGFYFVKQDPDTKDVVILLQNSVDVGNRYSRHNLQFAQIAPNGNISYHYAGYDGQDGETSNAVVQGDDIWEFDKSVKPPRPLFHRSYDEHGNVKFTEAWDYSEDSDIKYVMKNADGKVLSILKEIPDGDTNYRKEHVFYDNSGNTTMSVSANFEGPNLKRFTYYDSDDLEDSMTIESEYSDEGYKTEEKIYNKEYKLTNTVKARYADGERKEIKVLDGNGNEIKDITN